MFKRRALLAVPALAPLAAPALAQAEWPNKPVRVIIGYAAGGIMDGLTRLACDQLSRRLGQALVVEARSGAAGSIGAEALARSTPDGYTISTVAMNTVIINKMVMPSVPFDVWKDFSFISSMWDLPNALVVPADHVPARNVADFVTWARARRNGISFGSPGIGSTVHLMGEYFCNQTRIDGQHVPYRGGAPLVTAMLTNDVQMALDNLGTYTGMIEQGRIRPLAIAMAERWPTLPEVPTMAEAGFPNFDKSPWHFWAGPAGMPAEIVDRISREVRDIFQDPALQRRAIQIGARLRSSTPAELEARLRSEEPIWQEMVRISGASAG